MKLEYLPDAPGPVVSLYGFTPAEVVRLHTLLLGLAAGNADEVAVHDLPFVEVIGPCRLTLRVRGWDRSMVRGASIGEYECGFTRGTWDDVAALVEPFFSSDSGFQYLSDGGPGEADLLISVSGRW